jgi:hypothetical protein
VWNKPTLFAAGDKGNCATQVALLAACILSLAACGRASSSAASIRYNETKFRHRLASRSVGYSAIIRSDLWPIGTTGEVTILPTTRINDAAITFFRNKREVAAGEPTLVDTYLLHTQLPRSLKKALSPPSNIHLSSLEYRSGNVLVLWSYPLTHSASSKQLVYGCLQASRATNDA